jgi:hypothetical protein
VFAAVIVQPARRETSSSEATQRDRRASRTLRIVSTGRCRYGVGMSAQELQGRRERHPLATEEGVYGLILVAGLVAAASGPEVSALHTLVFVVVTVVVFWAAHVYAGAVSAHGPDTGVRRSVATAAHRSRGLLIAPVLPAIPLLLGAVGVIGDRLAGWASMWVIVATLAVLGYVAYRRRGARMPMRLLGALATASFGIVIILAKALVHH